MEKDERGAMKPLSMGKFMAVQALCGAALGWLGAAVILSIAIPRFADQMMSALDAAEFARLGRFGETLFRLKSVWLPLGLAAIALSWYSIARRLNPWLPSLPFRGAPAPAAAWISVIASGLAAVFGVGVLWNQGPKFLWSEWGGTVKAEDLLTGLVFCMLAWVIISPKGWAGRFSERARLAMSEMIGFLVWMVLMLCTVILAMALLDKSEAAEGWKAAGMVAGGLLALGPAWWLGRRVKLWLRLRWEKGVIAHVEACEKAGKPWADVESDYVRTVLLGFLFGLLVLAEAYLFSRTFRFLYTLNVDVWTRAAEIRFAGAMRIIAILCSVGAAALSIGAGLAACLASDGASFEERLRKAAKPLAALALVLLALGWLHHRAVVRHGWRDGSLAQAAALPAAAPSVMTRVTLGFDKKPTAHAKRVSMTAHFYSMSSGGDIPATEENAALLRKFIEGRGRESRYLSAAASALPSIYSALWEPELAVKAHEELAAVLGPAHGESILWQMDRLSWLTAFCPVTEANRARLAELCDPKSYYIPGRVAARLAKGWARFGDFTLARTWLEEARKRGAEEGDLAKVALSPQGVLSAGAIRGRVSFPDLPPKTPIRVGLFAVTDDNAPKISVNSSFLMYLTEACWAGRDGAFRFGNLSAGRYAILLMVPGDGPADNDWSYDYGKPVDAVGSPGILTLSRQRPEIDTGLITIRLKKK